MAILRQLCRVCGARHDQSEPHVIGGAGLKRRSKKVDAPVEGEGVSGWLISILGCQCAKCGYEWVPANLKVKPGRCPNPLCRSRSWHKEEK